MLCMSKENSHKTSTKNSQTIKIEVDRDKDIDHMIFGDNYHTHSTK